MESVTSSPIEKLANLTIKRHNLKPGFDIKEFLATQADLRFGKIPNGVDGISINLKSKVKRPVVIISTSLPSVRQKFTMAHELGHIVIPWHIGTILSHIDENHTYTSRLYQDCEVEANKFAAELLMPSQWVESLLNAQHPADTFEAVQKIVGTSYIATFYKVGSKISAEYISVLTSFDDRIISSLSNNPRLRKPKNGEYIKEQAIFKNAFEVRLSLSTHNKIYWLKYPNSVVVPTKSDSRSWREIFYPIIVELKLDGKLGVSILGCINAINKPGLKREEFYLKVRQRIVSDNNFFAISKHPDFELFLVRRIDELISNRKS